MTEPIPIEEMLYETSIQSNIAIMRVMNEIAFLERMKPIMGAVAQELVKAGVDFSNAQSESGNTEHQIELPVRRGNDQTNND